MPQEVQCFQECGSAEPVKNILKHVATGQISEESELKNECLESNALTGGE
jgi:hypothetical protein